LRTVDIRPGHTLGFPALLALALGLLFLAAGRIPAATIEAVLTAATHWGRGRHVGANMRGVISSSNRRSLSAKEPAVAFDASA
jgi:hypothetical protein